MKTHFITILLFPLLILGGCTSVEDYHRVCTEGWRTLEQQVSCVRANVERDNSMHDDALVQEYLLTGDKLAAEVRSGALSEQEGNLRWAEKLNDIRRRGLEEQALQAQINRSYDRHNRWCRYYADPFCW